MNVFEKVLKREAETDTRLGMPLYNPAHTRRAETMARMTGGNGFRVPPDERRVDAQGLTRGQRRRAAYATAMAKVSEDRAPEYMHSAARVRAGLQDAPKPMTGFVATMEAA